MRRRICIAGPISRGDLRANIQQADDAAGFAPVVPHWSCYMSGTSRQSHGFAYPGSENVAYGMASKTNDVPYETWMEIGLSLLSTCHALLRLPGDSPGADREVEFAREREIPVYFNVASAIELQSNKLAQEKQTDWSKVIGQWPGDETDEEIDRAMKEIE